MKTSMVVEEVGLEVGELEIHQLCSVFPDMEPDEYEGLKDSWADLAKTHSRDALRELVAKALGRKLRDPEAPGERFKKYILNQVPPDARIIAEEFFNLGERVVESENAIAILLAGMTECISMWAPHSKAGVDAEVGEHAA